jgi:hypothetical protein
VSTEQAERFHAVAPTRTSDTGVGREPFVEMRSIAAELARQARALCDEIEFTVDSQTKCDTGYVRDRQEIQLAQP